MAKDAQDPGTVDAFPPLIGRPRLDPEKPAMTPAERQRRRRAGKKEVLLSMEDLGRLQIIAERQGIRIDEALSHIIQGTRLPRKRKM